MPAGQPGGCTVLRFLDLADAKGLQLTSGDVLEVLARLTALTQLELGGVDGGGVSHPSTTR